MAFLGLILRSAFRNRTRTSLTIVGVALAVSMFLLLRSVASWYGIVQQQASDRFIVRNKISMTFPLSRAQAEKVRLVPGVSRMSWSNWFGGIQGDERRRFTQMAVDAESFFQVHDECSLAPEQMKAWLADRTGAVIGSELAREYGWKVGDKVVLRGTIYPGIWEFTVRGIYSAKGEQIGSTLLFHWTYLNEKVEEGRKDQVGLIWVKTSDPALGPRIDRLFANSLSETRTESELAFTRSVTSMVSGLLAAIETTSAGVVLILLLIIGNTMAMASRDRSAEYATMRAIGYGQRHVIALMLSEGFVIALLGVALGVLLSPELLALFGEVLRGQTGEVAKLELNRQGVLLSTFVALGSGMLATALPAWRAGRMRIVDALRRV